MRLLLEWLARRSLRTLHALGAVLGWLGYLLSSTYRGRLRANAERAGLTAAQRREAIAEGGRMVAEVPRLWLREPGRALADPVRWDDEARLQSWLGHPGGLVLMTPHMGCFEVAAQWYAETVGARQPITVLYRPSNHPWLRELEETARARPHLHTAPASLAGVRQMLRALRRGETVGLLPDQVPPDGMGEWAPFFGAPAYTMTLAARLVRQTGARLGVLWAERLPHGGGYVVHVLEPPVPLPEPPTGDATDAAAINASMEAVIRQHPGQYLWGYHRYKGPRGGQA